MFYVQSTRQVNYSVSCRASLTVCSAPVHVLLRITAYAPNIPAAVMSSAHLVVFGLKKVSVPDHRHLQATVIGEGLDGFRTETRLDSGGNGDVPQERAN
ncbi:hypothetical protein IVB30_30990 [Bradyrhizobium sp. 200]|uniref:hypothetical protein n=1 Tax=Bradyrhizobium sp. 200 TaxID=2782665 RepID=UPI001FFEDAC3|nr:hypothetical protein [Bradyrhizobium sp. 200]UPJ47659.1 hypothetical protein IVB30_30990 [Bradyrhizobium sp. 200]